MELIGPNTGTKLMPSLMGKDCLSAGSSFATTSVITDSSVSRNRRSYLTVPGAGSAAPTWRAKPCMICRPVPAAPSRLMAAGNTSGI